MIRLGPGGTAGLGYKKGLEEIQRVGLNALEVEFTHGVRMNNKQAGRVGNRSKKKDIMLSVHAPYYINLISKEKKKIKDSKKR